MTNIQPAIDYYGSVAALARAMGVKPQYVTNWKRRGLPPQRCREIAILTKGAVKASTLNPVLFAE